MQDQTEILKREVGISRSGFERNGQVRRKREKRKRGRKWYMKLIAVLEPCRGMTLS